MYLFCYGIYPSSTNFVTEYTLHVPIWWRDILFIYQFRDGILHFVLASYLSFVNIRFYIYIYICAFLRYICYWYSMRIYVIVRTFITMMHVILYYTSWKVLPTLPYLHYFIHPRCFSSLKGFYFRSIFVVSHIDIHDITERLLKVALNTINQTNQAHWYSPYTHLYRSILKRFLKRVMYMVNIHVNCGVYSEYAIDAYFSTK